jgi:hypothetical protein
MSFGDQSDPGQVIRRDLEAYAREIQMGSGLVFGLVEEFLTETPQKLEEAAEEFRDHYGDSPILEMVRLQVAKNLKRAANTIR